MDISMDIDGKSVDMDMDGKFHIYGKPDVSQPFRRSSLLKCAPQPQITKKFTKTSKTSYFGGSRSFKIIDADTPKQLVSSTGYDKKHVCVYVQPFSCCQPIAAK